MVDITAKHSTKREAIAEAIVKVSDPKTIVAILEDKVPKGKVLEIARAAGLLGVKQTANLIPDCHPLPIEYCNISYDLQEMTIHITFEVKTVYKTGVEVEAMHGASVVALTLYDMLKPIDKGIEISTIRLLSKKGGKTDFRKSGAKLLKTGLIVISDSVSDGVKEDKSGKLLEEKLNTLNMEVSQKTVVPDEKDRIQKAILEMVEKGIQLILTTGGTGLSPRDVTPEAVREILDREIPGIMEAARSHGQDLTPYAMLSRGVAGMIGKTLVMTLPGSSNGARESFDALFPGVLHVYKTLSIEYKHQDVVSDGLP